MNISNVNYLNWTVPCDSWGFQMQFKFGEYEFLILKCQWKKKGSKGCNEFRRTFMLFDEFMWFLPIRDLIIIQVNGII